MESCFTAEPVGDLTHTLVVCRTVDELIAISTRNGIDHKMIMIMSGVAVGSDNDLKAVAPHFLGKLSANGMGCFCIHLICLKRLVAVIAKPSVALTPIAFSFHELLCGCILPTVDGRNKSAGFSFDFIGGIFHNTVDCVERRHIPVALVGCLFRIYRIVDDTDYTGFHRPDGSDSH